MVAKPSNSDNTKRDLVPAQMYGENAVLILQDLGSGTSDEEEVF